MLNTIEEAAYLIRCGLKPKLSPHNDVRYRDCINTYQTDDNFPETVGEIAAGLGLLVLDVSLRGIVLAIADRHSPFRPALADIHNQLTATEQRLIFGTVLLTVAAICYPDEGSLEFDRPRYVNISEVRRQLIELAQSVTKVLGENESVPSLEDAMPILRQKIAAEWVLEKAPIMRTSAGGYKAGTLHWTVEQVFKYLEEQGFIVKDKDKDDADDTYKTFSRFKVYVREFAAIRAFEVIKTALAQASEDDTGETA